MAACRNLEGRARCRSSSVSRFPGRLDHLRDSKNNLSELDMNEVPEEANEKKECDRSMVRNPRERADSSLAVGAAKLSTFRFRGTKVHFRETSRFLDSRAIW
jgi:hypothetical protein